MLDKILAPLVRWQLKRNAVKVSDKTIDKLVDLYKEKYGKGKNVDSKIEKLLQYVNPVGVEKLADIAKNTIKKYVDQHGDKTLKFLGFSRFSKDYLIDDILFQNVSLYIDDDPEGVSKEANDKDFQSFMKKINNGPLGNGWTIDAVVDNISAFINKYYKNSFIKIIYDLEESGILLESEGNFVIDIGIVFNDLFEGSEEDALLDISEMIQDSIKAESEIMRA